MRPSLALLMLTLAAPAAGADRPLTALPYTPGLDPAAMDRGVDPCVDFYAYACGGWLKANPIPPDQARWDVYRKLATENRQFLWGLLEEAARKPARARSAVEAKVGDYFAACMDERAIDRKGLQPIAGELASIGALRSTRQVGALMGGLQPSVDELAFRFSSAQDGKDASKVIGLLDAGGLGLPDRDYYLKDDARSEEIRRRYQQYLTTLLGLAGDAPPAAADHARAVLRLETALARASLARVDKRDPYKVYHPLGRAQVAALAPALDWKAFFARAGAPARMSVVNVTEPLFLLELSQRLQDEPLEVWKAYLRARLVDERAPYLSRALQRARFEFHDAFLDGVKEEQPRWKKCVGWVDRDLGEALGQLFVAQAFPAQVKDQVADMTRRIEEAMARHVREADWMSAATKKAALEKLAGLRNKVGYPDRWRDYSALAVRRDDFAGDVERAVRLESARQLAKIGRPLDRGEWEMTPPTVNAYYNPQMNDINFPAGVLLPPLWDPRMDLAPGYGDTGATIGHELTHGFDDEGRQFDAKGNLRDWWTPEDAASFAKRAQCVIDQFAAYPVVDDIKINSKLTVGEDVADLGGTALAWDAWRDATRGQALEAKDGLTPEQRFFVGNAQWACENATEEIRRKYAVTDPHSPARWRVNGLFANLPEFREAFACKAGQPMAAEKPCKVW